MISESEAMQALLAVARKAARAEATILIEGETGTGKERLAKLIHAHSPRRDHPFVGVNCGAVSESLLESELFGHRKGAFTGALEDRDGVIRAAHRGTLFLDEVGEMTPAMQIKLLRVLQERSVRGVGEVTETPVDVRLVAATNRDLRAMVEEGNFRRDLLYRLRVVPLVVPPLRERRDDIVPLAREFMGRFCGRNGCSSTSPIEEELAQRLRNYGWPGNVRELENAIERAVVLASGHQVTVSDLPEEITEHSAVAPRVEGTSLKDVERAHILDTLLTHGGNRRAAARSLGIAENTLRRKLEGYNGALRVPN